MADLGHFQILNSPAEVPAEGGSIYGSPKRPARPDYRIDHETGCWEWLKSRTPHGYPCGPKKHGIYKPHRIYFFLGTGIDPTGLDVHHKCENPGCVNPAHLEAVARDAHLRDHKRPLSLLTLEQVAEIKSSPLTMAELARKYGISYWTIRDIVRGRNWKSVDAPEPPPNLCRYCGEPMPGGRNRRYCNDSHKLRARWRDMSQEAKAAHNAYNRERRRKAAA